MNDDIYYIIYGVKLQPEIIKNMLDYLVCCGDYVEEIDKFTDELDPDIIIDYFVDEDLIAELIENV